MLNLKSVVLSILAVGTSSAVLPLSSYAVTLTFSDQATFLTNIAPGFYLENFGSASR
ncbi:hypothetical protein Syn7502_02479 [Synechococcus sp. PCC 7502]|uniref:hypothetical protein n=1 Tax=Synechococcus sp. PCC 7502 TaxID=1173263 RepID=UPI00029F9879|nr:hypothetical protein [Synechococcus sp. PCC 7502]AFY74457.1 hypothetical protein Syn7502_02479 [Synechococcus sp. PCC 7502]